MMVTFQLTTAWRQLFVEKCAFTFVSSHFSPQSVTLQRQSEALQKTMNNDND